MIRTLGGVAMLSGFLIVAVFQATLPGILENKRIALERAVFEVLPGAESRVTFEVGTDGFTPLDEEVPGVDKVYAGYNAEGALTGVAIEAAGQGYQDVIRVLYGYSPDGESIIGFKVLESKETPGLGDRIGKDARFLANFDGLAAGLDASKSNLAHPIEFVKQGEKTQPWQIDGITGATISSRAVARMLDERSREIVPIIMQHVDRLKEGN
jgi:electron transport complex protein RnfG